LIKECVQTAFVAIITATLFLRTHIHRQTYQDATLLAGFLFFTIIQLFFNGELPQRAPIPAECFG